jgi:hypothetical protein
MISRVIFGDNQFFGVNHNSEYQAIQQARKFRSTDAIFEVLKDVNECGIDTFMFTTHSQMEPILRRISKTASFDNFNLIPCMPYAHKYANAVSENGFLGAIEKFIPGNKLISGLKGISSVVTKNPITAMKLLIDSEMKLLERNKIQSVFLQNIATDLLLGLGMDDLLCEFADYLSCKYHLRAGFITMNHLKLAKVLRDKGFERPMICSPINPIGFRMNPSQKNVEDGLSAKYSFNIAMSIMASGAVSPSESIKYLKGLHGIDSVLFGASSKKHILETKALIDGIWKNSS